MVLLSTELISQPGSINHGTSWEIFVHCGILPPIQLIHDNFPYGQRSSWAVLQISMTSVRHLEVQSVWPQRRVLQRCCDRGVIQKSLFLHHGELVISSHP